MRAVVRLLCALAAGAVSTTPASAGPPIGHLRASDLDATSFCQFSSARARESIVLEINLREARMRIDGSLVTLSVAEKQCVSNCVGPGRSGLRVFQLSGSGVSATLTKQVTCARDAEVCGGLPEGTAQLAVSNAAGQTAMTLWGAYCDL